ncbi:putative C6 transcription factor [Paraphoma chrysanthemicola]|nr:putative C6 transcription factor [Paraphoma chrysanthemicola]
MKSTTTDREPIEGPRRKRLKVDLACDLCRRRKVKCDGGRPACGNCSKRPMLLEQCVYAPNPYNHPTGRPPVAITDAVSEEIFPPSGLGRGSIRVATCLSQPPAVCGPSPPLPVTPMPSGSYVEHGAASYELFGGSSSSAFIEQIKAVIEARFGEVTQPRSPTAIPMVNISLFPSHQDVAAIDDLSACMEYEMPPRKQADNLVEAYWSQMDPIFPVLSKPRFMHAYIAYFSGTLADPDERIFVCKLNTIFALSAQLQETLDQYQRERMSCKYFQRAQALLQLPFWEKGSIDLIQCLLLMSQYLQCTNSPHQMWMVVGSAARIAQSLGLHLSDSWTDPLHKERAALNRRVWQSCIMMDRILSIGHGRPAMIAESFTHTVLNVQHHVQSLPENDDRIPYNEFVVRSLELYEITYHALQRYFSPPRPRDLNVDCLDYFDPTPTESRLALMIQVDGSLRRWEISLPAHLKFGSSRHLQGDICSRQATILHLRFLHSQILLFRPMLARCCLATEPESRPCGSLSGPLIEQCASACVTAARNMIIFINPHQITEGSVLPAWWYRVLYAYTAATVLAVSTLRPDLFPRSVTHAAWENVLTFFEGHEHMSEPVRVCKVALERTFSKIQEISNESVFASLPRGDFLQ